MNSGSNSATDNGNAGWSTYLGILIFLVHESLPLLERALGVVLQDTMGKWLVAGRRIQLKSRV